MSHKAPLPLPPEIGDRHWQVALQFAREYDRVLAARFRFSPRDTSGAQQHFFGEDFCPKSAVSCLPADYLKFLLRLPDASRTYSESIGHLFEQFTRMGMRNVSSVQKVLSAVADVVLVALRKEMGLLYCRTPRKGRKALILRVAGLPHRLFDLPLAQRFFRASYDWAQSAKNEKERRRRLRHSSDVFVRACTLFTLERQRSYTNLPPRLWHFLHADRLHVPAPEANSRAWVLKFPALISAMDGPRTTDQPVYIEILINLYCGARVADSLAARTQSLSDLCLTHRLIHGDEKNTRKRNDYACPPMPEWVFHDLKELAGNRTYLISDDAKERARVHQRALEFVRRHLAGDNTQVMYLLRKIYVTALTHHLGSILPVRLAMNHRTVSTTEGYFIPEFTGEMYRLWLAGPRAAVPTP